MSALHPEELVKINQIKQVVCEYYCFDEELLFLKSKKNNIPLMKQIVCYLVDKYTTTHRYKMAEYFDFKQHSNVLHGIARVIYMKDEDPTFSNQLTDLEKILQHNGMFSKKSGNTNWMEFIDLNNCIATTKNGKSIIFVNYTEEEIKTTIPDVGELQIFQNTNKFLYKRKTKKRNDRNKKGEENS